MRDTVLKMARGKLIIVFAPTGSGKSVLSEYMRSTVPGIEFVKSYTTRARRSALENASYEFIDAETFDRMKASSEFIEWAEFSGNRYGTRALDVEGSLEEGKTLFKEMEVQGVRQMLTAMPREDLYLVYVDAGPWEALEARARARGSITEEEIAKRKIRYEDESSSKGLADIVIQNYDGRLEEAKTSFVDAIRAVMSGVH